MFKNILLVCVGNICRSPMAEALLAHQLAGKGVRVESAGIGALVGHAADPMVQTLMQEQGIDITTHRARQLNAEMIKEFELILVMEAWQQKEIESAFPQARGRVHRLGKWSDIEIPDPYRKPRNAFEEALKQIETGLDDWKKKLAL